MGQLRQFCLNAVLPDPQGPQVLDDEVLDVFHGGSLLLGPGLRRDDESFVTPAQAGVQPRHTGANLLTPALRSAFVSFWSSVASGKPVRSANSR